MECYYFGTFNPPHTGHIKIAHEVLEKFNFDKIIFVPSNIPPHKESSTEGFHRFNMLKLIAGGKIKVSDIELRLPSPSYTYRTIEAIKKEGEKINFIIGYDAFKNIESWKNTEFLKENLHFIVLQRRGEKREEIEKLKQKGYDFIIADDIDMIDVSSTEAREKISKNEDTTGILDEKIREYIEENGLYKRN